MKKIILCLLLLSPIFSMAQTDYVQMKNCGSLCFIPSEYSAKETPNLHILQSDGVGIYDNDISQVKNISLPLQEYTYQSSRTRNRSVEGVERTAIERLREVTDVYISYAASQDKDYATLSYEERQNLIVDYDSYYYGATNTAVHDEGEYALIVCNEYYGNNFFNYSAYKYTYPMQGLLLDKDGKVYNFRATYDYKYSEWSDYTVSYETIKVENNIISCNIVGAESSSLLNPFYISSTLFNDDSSLEYLRPIYTLVDAPTYEWVGGGYSDEPVTTDGEYSSKELAISGLEVVSESGAVLSSISFGKEYSKIGNLSLMGGTVVAVGNSISIIKLGDNRFISFDTAEEEDGETSIYKHFYKINVATNSIEAVSAPVCVSVVQNTPNTIEVDYNTDKDANAALFSVDGQKCASQVINAGTGRFRMNVNGSGVYILTISEDGAVVGSQKILVK